VVFCTTCGSKMDDTSKFCSTCGAPAPSFVSMQEAAQESTTRRAEANSPAPVVGATHVQAADPQNAGPGVQPVKGASGGNVLKIVLIIVVVLVGLGLLSMAGMFWAAHKVRNAVRVEQNGNSATVTTPWGKVSSNEDPVKVARELGVDVYPGAKPVADASAVTLGNLSVGTVQFETADDLDNVLEFYRARYPDMNVDVTDEKSHTIATMTGKGIINIVLERSGDITKINISRTRGGRELGETQ